MGQPIIQFGTSRFLLAHAALFVSQALERGEAGQAVGGICVVQTTGNQASAARVAALSQAAGYPVHIRGVRRGATIDQILNGRAVHEALQAVAHWPRLLHKVAHDAKVIVSNTADSGYQLDALDTAALLHDTPRAPRSFPAKLLLLLHHRWTQQPETELSIYPCELIERNGDMLRDLLCELAGHWALPSSFIDWLRSHCVWANSLVDRIVSEAIAPVGAVAEPYALWAIEQQPRLRLPCVHESIVLTNDLARFARLKLFLLNGGHTFLAERWLRDARAADETVLQAMQDAALRAELEALWREEMLPVFDALGLRDVALCYLAELRERLLNPFLEHRLGEIANNHAQKKQRRFAPLIGLAQQYRLHLPQRRLRAALAHAD
ncbi:MAG: mannitol dehydrogenase family protein [Rubrivivax sp.]